MVVAAAVVVVVVVTPQAPAPGAVRVTTVAAVVVVALIAAIVSYSHMQQLAYTAGEGWRSWLIPLSIDGTVVAASMVLVTRRRTGLAGGWLAWSALGAGALASLAANMADARPEITAVLVAGWAPVAFAICFELLLQQRRADQHDTTKTTPAPVPSPEPVPQRHRPLAPTPAAAAPANPGPPALPVPQPAPSHPVPTATATTDALERRLRALIERAGRTPGRRVVARELGISEHQARTALERITAPPSPAASLNGTGGVRR